MPTWTSQSKNTATATSISKTSMDITEIDAEFTDNTSITFTGAINMVFREASNNEWVALSKT